MIKHYKRRRAIILLTIFFFAFIVLLLIGNLVMYLTEASVNPMINNLNDSFRSIETIYKISGDQAVYPVTFPGRITAFSILLLSGVIGIAFAAQVFALLNSLTLGKFFRRIKKDIDQDQKQVLDEFEETQDLEQDILKTQEEILSKEEDIMKKLDELRKHKSQ
jgi:hypothetical protein